jgi:hypothetical protein
LITAFGYGDTRWRRTPLLVSSEQIRALLAGIAAGWGEWAPANAMAQQMPQARAQTDLEARIADETYGARTFGAGGRAKRGRDLSGAARMRTAYGDRDSDSDDGRELTPRGRGRATGAPARMTAGRDAVEAVVVEPQHPSRVAGVDPNYNYKYDRAMMPIESQLADLRIRGAPFFSRFMFWWLSHLPITCDNFLAADRAFGPLCEHFVIRPEIVAHANSMVLFAGGAQTGITAVSRAYSKEYEDREAKRTVTLSLRVANIVTRPESFHLLSCTGRNYNVFGHGMSIFKPEMNRTGDERADDLVCRLYDANSQQYRADLVLSFVPPRDADGVRPIKSVVDFSGSFVKEEFPMVDATKIHNHYPGSEVMRQYFMLDDVHALRREKLRLGMPLLANTICALGDTWRLTAAGYRQVTNGCSPRGHIPLFGNRAHFGTSGPEALHPHITTGGRY